MLMLMEILSNPFGICMYFPSPIGIRGAIYIVLYRGGKNFLNRSCNRKKSRTFINSKKIEKIERKERKEKFVVPHNAYLTYLPVPPKVSCLLSFVLAFIPLSYRHTDRSRPIFCLYLALTYMDLLSRTVLSVELGGR